MANEKDDSQRKALTLLHPEQRNAYENAKAAVESDVGESLSSGDVVKELAQAYTGWGASKTDRQR